MLKVTIICYVFHLLGSQFQDIKYTLYVCFKIDKNHYKKLDFLVLFGPNVACIIDKHKGLLVVQSKLGYGKLGFVKNLSYDNKLLLDSQIMYCLF